MNCKRCSSTKLTCVAAKTADRCCTLDLDTGEEKNGYSDENPRLDPIQKWGDYLEFTFCSECGQIQEIGG